MNNALFWALLRYTLVAGAAIMAFIAHLQYSRTPLTMNDMARAALAVPHAASQDVPALLRAAAARGHNYIAQLVTSHVYASRAVPVTNFRIWDGFAAVLAIVCMYRVAVVCCCRSAGVLSAFLLAATAPPLWGRHALVMACALLHFELLVHAVRHGTLVRWLLWMLASVLLMLCGVFAELLVLQTWFATLALAWLVWFALSRWLPAAASEQQPVSRRHFRRAHAAYASHTELTNFILAWAAVAATGMVLVSVLAIFFTRFALTPSLILYIIAWGTVLSVLAGVVLLCLPIYSHERSMLIDRLFNSQIIQSIATPDKVFTPVPIVSFLNMVLTYAAAMVVFIPVLYVVHTHISVFVRFWDGALLVRTMREIGMLRALVFMSLPFVWAGATAVLYAAGGLSRGRCIGALCATLMSTPYLLQQRYAAYAAPFFYIALAGVPVVLVESVIHVLRRRHARALEPAGTMTA